MHPTIIYCTQKTFTVVYAAFLSSLKTETAAHAIAKIFCDNRYEEILSNARKAYNIGGKGDPDVFAARKMAELYGQVYQDAYDQAAKDNP